MLVETFAQYSALLVMEQHYGKDQVRRFLKYELDRYLRSRGGAVLEELPLDRVEDQDYIYYRKGSVAMYWAKEALGEDVVNRAMRKLLAQYAFKGAPYAEHHRLPASCCAPRPARRTSRSSPTCSTRSRCST